MEKKFNINEEFFSERMKEMIESYPIPDGGYMTLTRKMNHCLDVGANVGAFSVLFSEFCNKVISVEPYKPNYDFMVNKIKELKIDNIITYNKAISSKDGEIINMNVTTHESDSKDISTTDPKDWTNVYGETSTIHLGTAETMTYSYITENYSNIDYMKVDCEGCEYDLLMGADLKDVKLLALELHGGYIGKKKKRKLMNYLGTQFKTILPRPDSNEVFMLLNVNVPVVNQR